MSATYNDTQLDALRELANIGAGNASTALSGMLGRSIDLAVPDARLLPMADAVEAIGPAESEITGIALGVEGDMPATVLMLLTPADAETICGMLGLRARLGPGAVGAGRDRQRRRHVLPQRARRHDRDRARADAAGDRDRHARRDRRVGPGRARRVERLARCCWTRASSSRARTARSSSCSSRTRWRRGAARTPRRRHERPMARMGELCGVAHARRHAGRARPWLVHRPRAARSPQGRRRAGPRRAAGLRWAHGGQPLQVRRPRRPRADRQVVALGGREPMLEAVLVGGASMFAGAAPRWRSARATTAAVRAQLAPRPASRSSPRPPAATAAARSASIPGPVSSPSARRARKDAADLHPVKLPNSSGGGLKWPVFSSSTTPRSCARWCPTLSSRPVTR